MGFKLNRRKFLKILGAGGVSTVLRPSVSEPAEKLIPYLIPPFEIIPGVASWFATVCRECPAGCGMIVRVREGRAVKVEGNPHHPINKGKLCARGQAALHGLYNPDRIRQPLFKDEREGFRAVNWDEAENLLASKLRELLDKQGGSKIAFISDLITGAEEQFIRKWLKALGSERLFPYEVFSFEQIVAANKITFGEEDIPDYDFEKANLILSFGTDFLETWISPVEYSRTLAARRTDSERKLARFIQVEPRMSLTGANADEWIVIEPGQGMYLALGMVHLIIREGLAAAIPAAELERLQVQTKRFTPKWVAEKTGIPEATIERLSKAFAGADPGLALGGGIPSQTGNATYELVAINLLNYIAGNVGRTVRFGNRSHLVKAKPFRELKKLVEEMKEGKIEVLLVNDLNPVYFLPQTAGFDEALQKVPFLVSFSSYMDETTEKCHLVLPNHTPLESWGDYEMREGLHGFIQPTMKPLYQTKALGDVLLSTLRKVDEKLVKDFPEKSFQEYLKNQWKLLQTKLSPEKSFEEFWEEALRKGGVFEAWREKNIELQDRVLGLSFKETEMLVADSSSFDLSVYPSIHCYDGRGANRPWLQEQPDPITQIVSDTWVEIHPQTAGKLKVKAGDLIQLKSVSGEMEGPVFLYEGIHPRVLGVPIGQGHGSYGRFASGVGDNPYRFMSYEVEEVSGGRQWQSVKVTVEKLLQKRSLVQVGGSSQQFNRGIARALLVTALNLFIPKEKSNGKEEHSQKSLYEPHEHKGHRWAMAIDLQACTGCGACVVACYAENNIPFVGKQRIRQNRIMSWIRIERYFEKRANRLEVRFIPMLCQHCDYAPCEPVCPVYATYHTKEGLNAQIYNRCVGTRYCSNNCPYKVRRFNWFTYNFPEPLNWQLNPDVSVRTMGLMEKCTFCVQRIREKKDLAKDENRAVRDGEIVPACAQTCPAGAVTFGDLKNPDSMVAKLSKDPRGYHVLEELNTRPSITYLKRIITPGGEVL